jgi:hypothetical protein
MPTRRNLIFVFVTGLFSLLSFRRARGDALVFYVSAFGDDDNDGRSPSHAWKTVEKVNNTELSIAAKVLFARGGIWRETLEPRSDYITIGSFGTGQLPIITGADLVEKLTAASSSLDAAGEIECRSWIGTLIAEPTQIFVDGVRGERVSSAREVENYRRWHWASKILTVGAPGSKPPIVEASVRNYAIVINGRKGLTIENIQFSRGAFHTVLANTLTDSTLQRLTIADAFVTGISAGSDIRREKIVIQDCNIIGCGGGGIGIGGRLDGWLIQRNVVRRCCQLTESVIGTEAVPATNFRWTCGIKNWGWGQAGWQGIYTIRQNMVVDCGPVSWAPNPNGGHGVGIWSDEIVNPVGRPSIVYNIVAGCYSRGCYLEKVDEHDVDYNLIYRCANLKDCGSIAIQANKYGFDLATDKTDSEAPRSCTKNRIRHNTIVGGWWQLEAVCNDRDCFLSNNLFEDNIFCPRPDKGPSIYIRGGATNDQTHGSGNLYQNNNWGSDKNNPTRVWQSVSCPTLGLFQAISRGAIIGSIVGDPLFADPFEDDYTLQIGSPCRDVALRMPLDRDIIGKSVPLGAAADIGCYEGN